MRRDAERNRNKLIAAASEVMRSDGSVVSMEDIAERAGLTRGTIYRNFPHRQAMYEAVLEHDLETSVKRAVGDDADPLAFVRRMADLMVVYDRFLVNLPDMFDYDAERNQAKMIDAITAALNAAKAAGMIRSSVTGADILMACRMLACHWRLDGCPDRTETFNNRLRLLVNGLGPVAGHTASD